MWFGCALAYFFVLLILKLHHLCLFRSFFSVKSGILQDFTKPCKFSWERLLSPQIMWSNNKPHKILYCACIRSSTDIISEQAQGSMKKPLINEVAFIRWRHRQNWCIDLCGILKKRDVSLIHTIYTFNYGWQFFFKGKCVCGGLILKLSVNYQP